MDFTLTKYSELLDALKAYGFEDLTIWHDVDITKATTRAASGSGAPMRMTV